MNTIIKIVHYVDTNTLDEHTNDCDILELSKAQPRLFKMITDPKCDRAMLYNLVILNEQIKEGKLKSEDADKQFGEVAAKRYVYPLVNEN
jgi:hypothetical protein